MLDIESRMEGLGLSPLLLMENAAGFIASQASEFLSTANEKKVLVVCGNGNNGGDGMAAARLLFARGFDVTIFITREVKSVNALHNLTLAKHLGINIIEFDLSELSYLCETSALVIDAIFGTGFSGQLELYMEQVFKIINTYARCVFSVDLPSGTICDNGRVAAAVVKAQKTLCLGFVKRGLLLYPAAEYVGQIELSDISIPEVFADEVEVEAIKPQDLLSQLPGRALRSNKGTHGRLVVFAGSDDMPGAALICSQAAYKSGCGLVSVYTSPKSSNLVNIAICEAISKIVISKNGYLCKRSIEQVKDEITNASAVIVGPGMGNNEIVREFVEGILPLINVPLVLDADALNVISYNPNILSTLNCPCIITPHPREFSRLTGYAVADILNDTITLSKNFSKRYGVITVLKDARTIVSNPEGFSFINLSGNQSMAKAGSGDVLTGIIGSFLAQGISPFMAAKLAVTVHGLSGERASKSLGLYGVNASDIIQNIPLILQ